MSFKLAIQNVKGSIKDYSIYFLTITLGAAIFYTFNSIDSQSMMMTLSAQQSGMIRNVVDMIGVLSWFVTLILAFLVLYSNTFMMRRRNKELAIYMLLGMSRTQISRILVLEAIFVGSLSIICGIGVGVILSHMLAILTANIFAVQLDIFHFVFSMSACIKSIVYMSIIFVGVIFFNMYSINKSQLIHLLQKSNKNESMRIRSIPLSVILFFVSIILLAIAYKMLFINKFFVFDPLFFLMLVIGSLGTVLFFYSLAGFFLQVVKANKSIYYRSLNMFLLRQINNKITTTYLSVSVICIMLLLSIGIFSSALGANQGITSSTKESTPFDLTLYAYGEEEPDFAALWQQYGIDVQKDFKQVSLMRYYETKIPTVDIIKEFVDDVPFMRDNFHGQTVNAIALSDFNQTMKLQSQPLFALGSLEYGLLTSDNQVIKQIQAHLSSFPDITIDGNLLQFNQYNTLGTLDNLLTSGQQNLFIILPDDIAEVLEQSRYTWSANYATAEKTAFEEITAAAIEDMKITNTSMRYQSFISVYLNTMGIRIILLFFGLYLGIIFLIASSAVLALQQLCEVNDSLNRYRLLKKLGVENKMLNQAIFRQIAIYFLLPLFLAIIHSIVGISAVNETLQLFGTINMLENAFVTALFLIFVYGCYFYATYAGCRRFIQEKS